jgi:hypothetical protein
MRLVGHTSDHDYYFELPSHGERDTQSVFMLLPALLSGCCRAAVHRLLHSPTIDAAGRLTFSRSPLFICDKSRMR